MLSTGNWKQICTRNHHVSVSIFSLRDSWCAAASLRTNCTNRTLLTKLWSTYPHTWKIKWRKRKNRRRSQSRWWTSDCARKKYELKWCSSLSLGTQDTTIRRKSSLIRRIPPNLMSWSIHACRRRIHRLLKRNRWFYILIWSRMGSIYRQIYRGLFISSTSTKSKSLLRITWRKLCW